MKKRIFAAVAALCLMAGTSAFAQTKSAPQMKQPLTPEQMAQRQTERMVQKLKLSEAQSEQVYQVNLEQAVQLQTQRKQIRAMRSAEAEKMKSILTTDQFVEWAQAQDAKPASKLMHNKKANGCKEGKKACDRQGPRKE